MSAETKITRTQLYELIWSEPMSRIAKRYPVSDSGLRKICKRLHIPLPAAGHWQRIKAGRDIAVPPLPDDPGVEQEYVFTESISSGETTVGEAISALQRTIEQDKRLPLKLPGRLVQLDPVIEAAKVTLEARKHSRHEGIYFTSNWQINIRVGTALIGRACRFMHTFLQCVRLRGHELDIREQETRVIIFGQPVRISCREKMKQVKVPDKWRPTVNKPTGVLVFKMESYPEYEWRDDRQVLDLQLPAILARMEVHAERRRKEQQEAEKAWARFQADEAELKDQQKRREQELEIFRSTLDAARRWKDAQLLREYAYALEQASAVPESEAVTPDWIRSKADWYDPVTQADDGLLSDTDRHSA
jgi:hypothetical protein